MTESIGEIIENRDNEIDELKDRVKFLEGFKEAQRQRISDLEEQLAIAQACYLHKNDNYYWTDAGWERYKKMEAALNRIGIGLRGPLAYTNELQEIIREIVDEALK